MSLVEPSIEPQGPPAGPKRRSVWLLRLAIGLPLIALAWYYVVRSAMKDICEIRWGDLQINWIFMAAALSSLVVGRLMTAMNCRYVLGAMGQRLPHRKTVPIICVVSLGRYIPGKMAVVGGAVLMLARLGVSWTLSLPALFLGTAMMILVGLVATIPLMFMLPALREQAAWGWAAAAALLAFGMICLHPAVFARLCNIALKRMKRQPLPSRLEAIPYMQAILVTLGRAFFHGLGLWLATRAFGAIGISTLLLALAAGGAASVVGFLAVFAPAGLGVHDGIYLATMGPLIAPQGIIMVALFRASTVLSDVITWAGGMVFLRGVFPQAPKASLATP